MKQLLASLVGTALLFGACVGPDVEEEAQASPSPAPLDLNRPLPDPLPEIVARVNGRAIQLAEIVPLTRDALRQYLPGQRDEKTPQTMRLALERYIDRELLVQEALARGVEADTRSVEKAYDQVRQDHPDDEEWSAHLAALGFTPQSFKAALRVRHTIHALVEDASDITPPTVEDARALYETDPKAFAQPAATPPPFEDVADEALARVLKERQDAFMHGLAQGLRAKARIETYI